MRIGLLVCHHVEERYRPIVEDYASMIDEMLGGRSFDLVVYDAVGGELPQDPGECDAYLISGSAASVYEPETWIRDLESFVSRVVEEEVPIVGICFGHQVLASALGGVVERSERGWGGGVHSMRVTQRRGWMAPPLDDVALIMAHQDQVVALPDGAALLGSSAHCPNFLVEFAPKAIGIQGHPEFPVAFAALFYKDRRDRIGEPVERALASLDRPTDADIVTDWIYNVMST